MRLGQEHARFATASASHRMQSEIKWKLIIRIALRCICAYCGTELVFVYFWIVEDHEVLRQGFAVTGLWRGLKRWCYVYICPDPVIVCLVADDFDGGP